MRRWFLWLAITLCTGLGQAVWAESVEWFTDAPAAQARAKEESKLVLLNFTGSDWCGWCMKLKSHVFDKPEFAEFARSRLVLVEVDFPVKKTLPQAQQEANSELQRAYGIKSYPTLILLDQDGKQVGRMGYVFGGPAAFIAKVEKAARKKPQTAATSPAPEPEKPRKPLAFAR
jgi:protein disulfide-isomerase